MTRISNSSLYNCNLATSDTFRNFDQNLINDEQIELNVKNAAMSITATASEYEIVNYLT